LRAKKRGKGGKKVLPRGGDKKQTQWLAHRSGADHIDGGKEERGGLQKEKKGKEMRHTPHILCQAVRERGGGFSKARSIQDHAENGVGERGKEK